MPAVSQKQGIWARLGCRESNMTPAQCADFVPHGPGSMKRLPVRAADRKRMIRRKVIGKD